MHIILGCDDVGKEALSFYRKMNSSPDCLFCDVDDIRNGDIIEGTRVISFKEMKNKSDDSDIVIADEYAYDRIAVKLWEAGIRKFNIYFNKNGGVRSVSGYDGKYGILNYLQFRVIDHCNLNCKSCGSVCNRDTPHNFVRAEEFEKDVKQCHKYVPVIGRIHILGGEPFLHPELGKILEVARGYYAETPITVVTNGLLVERMTEALIDDFKMNNIAINISGYPPVMERIGAISKFLEEKGIACSVRPVGKFNNFRRLDYVSDIKKAWDSCRVNSCTNYKSGILCGCSMIEAFEKMNRQFGTSYQMIEEEDYFDLYKTKQSIHDILSAFRKPKHICGYCDSKPATWFDWSLPNEEISVYDYVVDGKR